MCPEKLISGISLRELWDHAAYLRHPGAAPEPPSKDSPALVSTRYRPDFSLKYNAYLVGRKSRFRNIPARALGPRGIPHAPRTGTRTTSAATRYRPDPTQFRAQKSNYSMRREYDFCTDTRSCQSRPGHTRHHPLTRESAARTSRNRLSTRKPRPGLGIPSN